MIFRIVCWLMKRKGFICTYKNEGSVAFWKGSYDHTI